MADKNTQQDTWECSKCTMTNSQYLPYCEACSSPKHQKAETTSQPKQQQEEKELHLQRRQQWKCKLCSMQNNRYLSYCEECLVPRNVQINEKLFSQLQDALNSNDCDQHIKADDIKQIVHKLKDDFERLSNFDKELMAEIQGEIDKVYSKMNIQCEANIVKDFVETYKMDNHGFQQQRKSNKKCKPICKCGVKMQAVAEHKCYGNEYRYVICDICDRRIPPKQKTFHCPQKQWQGVHPDGFDICLECRKKYIHRLRRFVAIIICPTMAQNHASKDAETLAQMFTDLGFHDIRCLKGDKITKQDIEAKLQQILPGKNEDANQFTVICYSGHGELDENDNYHFAIDPDDPDTWISAEAINGVCQATLCGSACDGVKKWFNEWWYKTYYRHNTLLLINSCHSAGGGDFVDSQKVADSFGTSAALAIISGIFGLSPAVLLSGINKLSKHLKKEHLDCIKHCIKNGVPIEDMAACLGLDAATLIMIAKVAGITLLAVIVICFAVYQSVKKSQQCESIYVIASCHRDEESNSCFGVSPFVKHCADFFDIFLHPQRGKALGNGYFLNMAQIKDSPLELFQYLKTMYREKDKDLGGASLNDIEQTVCSTTRGFTDFAMCPMLNQDTS